MNIAMLGSGYVGLVAGVCFADAGHHVFCVDNNPKKINSLKNGQLPFYEPGLSDVFERSKSRLKFFSEIAPAVQEAEVVFVAVGTPELADGSADLSFTFNVLEEVCKAANGPKYVVLKSTVPIGTYAKVDEFCKQNCDHEIEVINNPEFLKQGAAVEDFLKPDRVVIGCKSERARELMNELYKPFVKNGNPIIFMDNVSAEMTKYAANSFLALKISFINELALLADKLGADIGNVRKGFTSDNRINPHFFYPGIGYGGSCFPKDVRALVHTGREHDIELMLLEAADRVNERQKTVLSERLFERFGDLSGKRVCLWGLSFKPNTDDVRRAPSLKLIKDLHDKGAQVVAYDPIAIENAKASCEVEFETTTEAFEALEGADALVIVTEWNEFKSADLNKIKSIMKTPVIFDGRNIFDREKIKEANIEYYGIGYQLRK